MLTIGFIGNFNVPYTTENERKFAFEKLGHKVVPLQENKTTANDIMKLKSEVDMLVYSHTHDPNYIIHNLKQVFAEYKLAGVPTVSCHLDRWVGLDRVKDVGNEATWFTEHIFMADGSPEAMELYESLNLNWHYLAPAVAENYCYLAKADNAKYPNEIVFTGSKGYHPEYPYRPQLVDWLHKTYGERFGHYGNDGIGVVRQDELNQVYASSKVVIGDSCFGGRPYYVSDRYYEVRGRGGFLIHPHQQGIDSIGVANYTHGDFNDLKRVIDYCIENDYEREKMRLAGYKHVKNQETYTDRARTILKVVLNVD